MSEPIEKNEGRLLSEQYGMSAPPAPVKTRPLAVIEAELDMLKQDTRQKETALLCNYIEVGRRLEEAKAQLVHGQWGEWLKKMEIAQSTANNFMRLYREYGDEQQSLFGSTAKSKTFGNLTYSKALKLLAISDEEERERFTVENDVEHMSVRELNEALKERDAALEEAAAAREDAKDIRREVNRLLEQMSDQTRVYEAKLTSAGVEAEQARAAVKTAQEALDKQRDKAKQLQDALSDANTAAQTSDSECARLLQELEELRNRPVEADTEAVEAARQAAIAEMTEKVDKAKDAKKKADEKRKATEANFDAAKKELAAAKKELEELKAKGPEVRELTQEEKDALTAEAVNRAKAEGDKRLRDLERKLAQADPDTATFKVLFVSWQETYGKMMEALEPIKATDSGKAERLQDAVRAVVSGWNEVTSPYDERS